MQKTRWVVVYQCPKCDYTRERREGQGILNTSNVLICPTCRVALNRASETEEQFLDLDMRVIQPHEQLVHAFNEKSDWGGPVPRSFVEDLLEQIRLRDLRIAELDKEKWAMNAEMIKMADTIIGLERAGK